MDLSTVHWPVFKLLDEKPLVEGTKLLYRKHRFNMDTAVAEAVEKVVDDTSIPELTIGKRRLELAKRGTDLQKITRAIYFLSDLVKQAKNSTWFIDSSGKLFQYKKHTRCSLICKRIVNIHHMKNMGASIEVQGMSTRFKTMFNPKPEQMYAGLLKYGRGYILYGLYSVPFKDTWRMV